MTTLKRLEFISSLRGFAALYVAAVHLTFGTSPRIEAPGWLVPTVAFGNVAVTLFFVLSAFTLSLSMEARGSEPAPIVSFFVRRFFRIAPLFYIWMVLSIAISAWLFSARPNAVGILLNIFFLFNIFPGHEWSLVYAGWSVGTEMLFYLAFPLLFMVTRTWKSALLCLMISLVASQLWRTAMLSQHSIPWPYPYVGIINQFPIFVIGIVVHHAYKALRDNQYSRQIGIFLLFATAMGMYLMAYPFSVARIEASLYLRGLLCGSLILGLGLFPLRMAVNRWTIFSGEISYSIYLSHPASCVLVEHMAPALYARFPHGIAYALSYGLLMLIVIPLSYATYRIVERPGIALGGRLINHMRQRKRNAVVQMDF